MGRASENIEISSGQHPFKVCYLLEVRDSSREVEVGIRAYRLLGLKFNPKILMHRGFDPPRT